MKPLIQLISKEIEPISIDVSVKSTFENYIRIHEEVSNDSIYLIQINHSNLTTILDFTNSNDFQILYFEDSDDLFDGCRIFNGVSYAVNKTLGNFLIQTQSKWILLIQLDKALKKETLNKLEKIQLYKTYWMKNFIQNPQFGKKRFKRIANNFPDKVELDDTYVDLVDIEDFIKIEDERIPLFIGTQFGIYPHFEDIPNFFNGKKLVAILGKSLLSGVVSGLSLYEIGENDKEFSHDKIAVFYND